jgi:hypothetical protein
MLSLGTVENGRVATRVGWLACCVDRHDEVGRVLHEGLEPALDAAVSRLTERLTTLASGRRYEICAALAALADC